VTPSNGSVLTPRRCARHGWPEISQPTSSCASADPTWPPVSGCPPWDWNRLVNEVRTGPPSWSPVSLAPVDEAVNTVEFFIHHEDVLRGGPEWSARELPSDLESVLWSAVCKVARLHFARARIGVVLASPAHGERQVHATTDLGTVVVTGRPGELLLYSSGRRGVAQVDLSGAEEALASI
jgi:uncharacterized protein (TIGR03085 family)